MKDEFQKVILQKVLQEENRKADEFAQMANTLSSWMAEDTIV